MVLIFIKSKVPIEVFNIILKYLLPLNPELMNEIRNYIQIYMYFSGNYNTFYFNNKKKNWSIIVPCCFQCGNFIDANYYNTKYKFSFVFDKSGKFTNPTFSIIQFIFFKKRYKLEKLIKKQLLNFCCLCVYDNKYRLQSLKFDYSN